MKLNLSGWQAIIALMAILLLVVFRVMSYDDYTGNKKLMEQVRLELTSEYFPADVERMRQRYESGSVAGTRGEVQSILSTRLNVVSIHASFPLFDTRVNKEVVVKVTYSLDDDSGNRQSGVKYYRYERASLVNTWQYRGTSNAVFYWLNFV